MTDFANAEIAWGAGSGAETITLLQLLKDQLGETGSGRDSELSMYLDMAGNSAEQYVDNVLVQREVVEQKPISGSPVALRYWPYVSGLAIEIDGETVTSDFELFKSEGVNWAVKDRCAASRSNCFDQMTLTYTAGYDPLPSTIGFAIVQGAMGFEAGADQGGPVSRETVVGVGTVEYTSQADGATAGMGMFPGSAVALLDQYRRYGV
jgi:hypothetical protein